MSQQGVAIAFDIAQREERHDGGPSVSQVRRLARRGAARYRRRRRHGYKTPDQIRAKQRGVEIDSPSKQNLAA